MLRRRSGFPPNLVLPDTGTGSAYRPRLRTIAPGGDHPSGMVSTAVKCHVGEFDDAMMQDSLADYSSARLLKFTPVSFPALFHVCRWPHYLCSFRTAASISDSRCTTAPLKSTAVGMAAVHTASGGYTATRSQRIPSRVQHSGSGCGRRASFASCFATKCFESQICLARESVILPRTPLPGFLQSVARIGSHTAKTATLASGFRLRTFWTAEAPRRHVVQVGERSAIMRTLPAASLNSFFSCANEFGSRSVRAEVAPESEKRYHPPAPPTSASPTMPIASLRVRRFFVISGKPVSQDTCNRLREECHGHHQHRRNTKENNVRSASALAGGFAQELNNANAEQHETCPDQPHLVDAGEHAESGQA